MRLLRNIALVAIATLLLLELTLQVFAFVVSLTVVRDPAAGARGGVLCIGDSFTYGIGASSAEHSYPAALRRMLRERGIDCEVANAGVPAQNSYEVAARLGAWLDRCRPSVVCVLIGTNDTWTDPARWEGDEDGEGFAWRWRTLRLVQWWLGPRVEWRERDAAAAEPTTDGPTATMLAMAHDLLERDGIGWQTTNPAPTQDPPPPEVAGEVRDAWNRLHQGTVDLDLLARLQSLAAAHPDASDVLPPLVQVAAQLAQNDEAARATEAMWALYERAPGFAHASDLVLCLGASHDARALSFARDAVEKYPDLFHGWRMIADQETTNRRFDVAAHAFERLLHVMPPWMEPMRPELLQHLADVLCHAAPERSAGIFAASVLMSGAMGEALIYLRCNKAQVTESMFRPYRELPELDPRGRRLLEQLYREVYVQESEAYLDVLEHNLRCMQRMVAARGARLVIVTYPFSQVPVERVQRAVGATSAAIAPVSERFSRESESRAPDELFAGDGHCNDAGYEIMAAVVADVIAGVWPGVKGAVIGTPSHR